MASITNLCVDLCHKIGVERLVEDYDVNCGARSVINAVKTLTVQILAESQVRGDIGEKCVTRFIYLSSILLMCQQVGSLIYLSMMLATLT